MGLGKLLHCWRNFLLDDYPSIGSLSDHSRFTEIIKHTNFVVIALTYYDFYPKVDKDIFTHIITSPWGQIVIVGLVVCIIGIIFCGGA